MSDSGRKKPTGKIGSLRIQFGPGDAKQTFSRIVFPATKREIEAAVLAAALAATANQFQLRPHYGLVGEPVQNDENDLDFTLPTASGKTYLELMETAPLEGVGSYSRAKQMYNLGDRADAIAAKIFEKSASYGSDPQIGVHLLLYTTDFRFDATGSICDLLVHLLHARPHPFKSVVYCSPGPTKSPTRLLFPLSVEQRQGLESEKLLRGITEVVFDMSQGLTVIPKEDA